MGVIARSVAWIVGSLSVAVLLRDGFGLRLEPLVGRVLGTYEEVVRALFGGFEGLINGNVLPHVPDGLGVGPALLPHWPHLFLLALLHMWPRFDGNPAVGFLKAAGAVVAALAGAVIVGASSYTVGFAGAVVMAFATAALAVNWTAEWPSIGGSVDIPGDDLRARFYNYLAPFVLLMGIGVVGSLHLLGVLSGDSLMWGWIIVGIVTTVAAIVGAILYFVYLPPFPGRTFRDAPITHLARLALFVLAMLLFLHATEGQSTRHVYPVFVVVGAFFFGAAFARLPLLLQGDEEPRIPPPPALGVFILGGAAIMAASYYLR